MASGKFVAYYRVSTDRQGRSGLGLEAQRQAIRNYLERGRSTLVAEHTEVESGRRNDRPELQAALAGCRVHGATLLVSKWDRLSRDARFLLTLRDAGVEIVAVDMPEANRLTITVMAAVAEHEAETISARTRAALAAAKARGVRLGNPRNLSNESRARGRSVSVKVRRARAAQRAADLAPIIAELRGEGASSLRDLAVRLNQRDVRASRGGRWTAAQVRRLLTGLGA
jgi:DNA invertase Pin-like site-specific DNA recombinase